MNFREKFEAWHKARFGYVTPARPGFTAMNVQYDPGAQQNRWEGWQACGGQFFDEGRKAGEAQSAALIAELEAALKKYADDFCEHSLDYEGCGKLSNDDCSGCAARRSLNQRSEVSNAPQT